MTTESVLSITDEADFLANAELLVQESLEQYGQLADSMELHNNLTVAAKFRILEDLEKQQLQWIEEQAAGLIMPEIAPWDFKWHCHDDPNKNCLSDMNYLVNPFQALSAALHNEHHSEEFYRGVAEQALDPAVKNLASELAEKQLGQIELLKQHLQALPKEAHELIEDMDPPNIPE
jgi:hypothetical protein